MAFKKISDLVEALEISPEDLFLLSDMVAASSKKVTFATLSGSLSQEINVNDLNGRFQEGSSYDISRDGDGLVSSISTTFGAITKTFTFSRDLESNVSSVNVHNSDNSYNKTYTFVRDSEGVVTSILISA